ncbi:MAG: CoA-acylating methylmalonate-semialdehyde dehydrogenase [Bifidobacteriaceae bacterium]|jgi:malonate-semialdehyde dehydrogenase (acetylating)/methylmalonate-semialdehyde dehydrogenase|nr:CoA-acylating methylmalonate-semialdehyde dehydrogenase [Bifidobacteriaceae bacterium]
MTIPVIDHFINGQRRAPSPDASTSNVFNPATGQVIAHVKAARSAEVNQAVAGAAAAFEAWSQMSLGRRTAVLFAFRQLLAAGTDELAKIVVREHGKVLDDARGEVGRGLDVVDFACGIPELLKGSYSPQVSTDFDVYSFREPLGVVAGITPFNFPVMVPLWMAPLAIATGNTFILKPSKQDPSASLFLADLWTKAGLPDGVFQVIQGGRGSVADLLIHPDIRAISFVGSTPVARHIHQVGTSHGKRVQALGGAKNHAVILPDADLDFAAASTVAAAFGAAGQRCMAIATAVVIDAVADDFVEQVVAKARNVKVADGMTPGVDMGAVISQAARDRIEDTVDSAQRDGAAIVLDGRGWRPADSPEGFFTGPTVIDHVRPGMRAYDEEIFGPVLTVVRVRDLDEALCLVNANPYGNGAVVFSASGGDARRFVRGVNAGMIGVNVPIPVPVPYYSFGGWKDSLIGESHIYGPDGVRFYTRAKVITQRWPSQSPSQSQSQGASFHFASASS